MTLGKLLNFSVPHCLHLNLGLLIRATFGRDNAMGSPKSTNTSYSFFQGTEKTSSPTPLRDGQGHMASSGPAGGVQVT